MPTSAGAESHPMSVAAGMYTLSSTRVCLDVLRSEFCTLQVPVQLPVVNCR